MTGPSTRKSPKKIVITGPDWQAALLALIVAGRFPHIEIAMACERGDGERELETFIHAELSPVVAATISDAIIREWPDFVITGGGTTHMVPMVAGVFDPSQMIASAAQTLTSVPPEAAHWQSVNADAVWIDIQQLWQDLRPTITAPAINSHWLDWNGPAELQQLVLADFGEDPSQYHRQYLPLSPGRIFARRVDHRGRIPGLDFSARSSSLAAQYMHQFPSRLACIGQLAGVATRMVSEMQSE